MKNHKSFKGFMLIDVLIALIIASTALIVILGSIVLGARNAALTKERLETLIIEKNKYEEERVIDF